MILELGVQKKESFTSSLYYFTFGWV